MGSAVNEPGQKTVIPGEIAEAMQSKGIRTLRALATKCGYGPMTIRRLFVPTHSHRMLFLYLRFAEQLGWSLEDYFETCLSHTPEEAGIKIANRIREKGLSLNEFSKRLGSKDGGGSLYQYIYGENEFRAMRIYKSIATELGITADKLAKSFATTFGDLHTTSGSGTVLESRATTPEKSIRERSEKSYLLRNTRWPRR